LAQAILAQGCKAQDPDLLSPHPHAALLVMKAAIAAAGLMLLATAADSRESDLRASLDQQEAEAGRLRQELDRLGQREESERQEVGATEAVNQSVAEAELEAANRSYQQAVTDAEHAVAKAESLAEQFKNVSRNETTVQAFAADIEERVRLEAEAKNLSLEKQAEALKEMYYINRTAHKMLAHRLEKEAKAAGRAVVKSGREVEHAAKKAKRKEREYERDYEHAERTGERLEERGERAGESAEDSVERLYERVERRVERKAHELRTQAREALEAAEKAATEKVKVAEAEAKLAKKQLKEDRNRAKEGDKEAEKEGKAEAKASDASAFLASAQARPSGTAMDLLAIVAAAFLATTLAVAGLRCRSGTLSRRGVVLDAPALG